MINKANRKGEVNNNTIPTIGNNILAVPFTVQLS
jgi:hypothetical protein